MNSIEENIEFKREFVNIKKAWKPVQFWHKGLHFCTSPYLDIYPDPRKLQLFKHMEVYIWDCNRTMQPQIIQFLGQSLQPECMPYGYLHM